MCILTRKRAYSSSAGTVSRRFFTASASIRSSGTVSSQPMQASVIDLAYSSGWPGDQVLAARR